MIRRSLFASIAISLLFVPNVAMAGVDVEPQPRRSSIVLKGLKVHKNYPQRGFTQVKQSRTTPRNRIEADCGFSDQGAAQCVNEAPITRDPKGADITEGDILNAVREIGLPSLKVRIQPGDETLVNIPTIFFTRPQEFERSVDLLGFDVDLVADPVSYHWIHDDGTTTSTSRPGKPYPAMDVTHRYREPAKDVHPRVDVTYQVRYRVDNGAWQTIDQTLLASGPSAALDVREAAPILSKP